jgi:uncharacterized protein YndB with AHSA1/START domain
MWLLVVIGGLVALFGLLAIAGTFLPVEHETSRTREIPAPPVEVWELVNDFVSWPSWVPRIHKMERRDRDGREVWIMSSREGELPSEVIERAPPSRLVTRISDPKLPFGGTWTWEITPDEGDQSLVTITERGEIYNPLFRFLARYLFGYHATIESYLAALSRRFASRGKN